MRIRPTQACLNLLALQMCLALTSPAQTSSLQPAQSTPVLIQVHAAQLTAPYKPIWNYFGADEPNYLYSPNGKKLLGELSALSPVPVYYRPHNLFTTGNGDGSLKWGSTNVYTEKPDGSPVYDFTITDRIFDALIGAHVRPLVEIGFMPEALSTHPEPYRHTFPKGEIFTGWSYPSKDEAKWFKLVVAYTTHLRERYGSQTSTWLWEAWNEPDIPYWHGTPAEYDRLYDFTVAAIRQVIPNAKVGGPEATGISDHSEPFLRQFLEHCAHGANAATGNTGAPLDFISYHPKGHPTVVDGHVQMSVATQLRAIERGLKVISSYPHWRHTPIILGESDPEGCGACLSPQNGYRNGPLYGVSVVEATMRAYELARKYNLTIQGAVTWAFEFEDQPTFVPLRALVTNGIDKPVLNAFRLMGMLSAHKAGGSWLATASSGALPVAEIVTNSVTAAPDVNAVATRNGREVDILVWNYHDADVESQPADVHIQVDGLQGRAAIASELSVDATHSNAYRVWLKMGSPAQLTEEQQGLLGKAALLEQPDPERIMPVTSGNAELNLTLPRQAVVLVRLLER